MPRLSGGRSGRPSDSLPSAPLGAQSHPLPTDPPAGAQPAGPSGRPQREASAARPSRGGALRALGAAVLAAAVLLTGLLAAGGASAQTMVPLAPANLTVAVHSTTTPGSIELNWGHPGGPNPTSWEFRTSTDSGVNWSHAVADDWPDTTLDSKFNSFAAGLTAATAYTFELRGRNADGYGASSNQATGTTAGAVSITGVALTSSPASGTTYDTGEDVVATLTFSRWVTFAEVGGNLPQLELNFGGTAKPAICAATNQQTAVTCTYTVVFGDAASGGVAIAANKLTLNGGTIRLGSGSNANVDYTVPLAHTALAADTDHKVSGTSVIPPEVASIALTSNAGTDDTYAIDDTVTTTVTFDGSVDISGTPQLELDFDGTAKAADCTAGATPTTMTCSYDVELNDSAPSGIAIAANKLSGGTIRAAGTTTAADRDHVAVAIDADHKVDGIRPTLVTTGTDAPTTSTDGTKVILTFSETLGNYRRGNITIQAGGVTLMTTTTGSRRAGRFVTVALATPLTSTATNLTVALAANAVEDLPGNSNLAQSATAVINVVSPGPAVSSIAFNSSGADGWFMTGNAVTATVTFSESVTVDTTDGTPQLTIKMGGADKVLEYSSGSPGAALVFSGYTVAANDEDTDGLSIEANKLDANGGTIQQTADTSVAAVLTHPAVAASANHKVDGVKPTLVTTGDDAPKTSLDGSKIILVFSENIFSADRTKFTVKVGSTDQTISGVSGSGTGVELTLTTALSATATNITVALDAEAVTDVPGNGIAAVSATSVIRTSAPGKPILTLGAEDQAINVTVVFSDHGSSDITKYEYRIKTTGSYGSWTNSGAPDVSNTGGTFTIGGLTNGTEYTVQARGVNSDGDGAASDAKAATPDAPPAITSVAITSTPANASTYIIGEDIEITVIFDKNITLSGTGDQNPYIEFVLESQTQGATCVVGTPTNRLVCTEEVFEGDEDTDGIRIPLNSFFIVNKTILGPLEQEADLSHSALAADSDHKVDGIRPTLPRADADPNDLTKIILTFSEAIGTVTQADITVWKGSTAQTITAATIDSMDATKVVVTLSAALLTTDRNVSVNLDADAVKDVPGNGIAEVLGREVSVEDNTAPTFVSAGTNDTDEVVLTYSEALNTTAPATSAFTVKVGGNNRGVDTVTISGSAVTLTLVSAFRPGDTLTVAYSKPGTNPIKDASSNANEAVSLPETAVTNNLADTAPEAPGNFVVTATHADAVALAWTVPWDNGSPIEKHQHRYAEGSSVPASTTWTDVPDSAPGEANATGGTVGGDDFKPGTQYAFEVRAVNGEGNGDEADATATTLTPTWSFGFYPVISGADKLTEGGASRTARLIIVNDVRFSEDQTVTLKWGDDEIDSGLIQGASGSATFTIDADDRQGELEISAPDRPGDLYRPPESRLLTANLGGEQVGPSIALEFVDDEAKPVATMVLSPTSEHSRGVSQMTVVEGDAVFPLATTSRGYDVLVHPNVRAEVTGSANKFEAGALQTVDGKTVFPMPFTPASATQSLGSSLTTNDNSTAGDRSEHVFTIVPNPDYYTIGTPSSATLIILDNDAAPTAPRNLRAQSRDGAVVLTWDPPTSLATTEFTAYELRHVAGSSPGGTFADISTDPDTGTHTVTGLTNETEYTFELRAKNSFGSSSPVSVSKTPRVGVAVSFGEATLSVEEGESAEVTVTLGEAPTASVTVPIVATQGTGLNSSEYSGVPSSVTFGAGQTSRSFTVATVDDTDDEPDRTLTFSFGTLPDGYVPGAHETLALTVADNDHPIVSATFDAAMAEVQEGTSVPVTVSLSQAPEREVVLPIRATRGAGLTAAEHEAVPASVTFTENAIEARFTLKFEDDAVEEGNETLTLTFGTYPDRVQAGTNTRLTLTVTDDDGPPLAPDVSVQTGDGYAELSWAPVANDSPVLRYEVRWRESDGGTFNAWQSVGLVTSYRVEGLTNGKAHEFEVRAVNAHGNGEEVSVPATPTARLTGLPQAVQVLQVKATDSSRAELSWTRPANGTDRVTRNSATAPFSQIQGYRIEVCRTTCGEAANWYALVPNTRAFVHKYVHQVLAPGVIRENRYRVQAININGKTGPWSNVGQLEQTRLERFWLVSPNSSTVDVHLEVWHPDGNPLYVRYRGGGEVRYKQQRLTKKGFPVIGLPVEASTHYKVEVDFVDTFDSPRLQSATVWSLQEGADPYTSPYAKDLLDAEVWRGGQWREAPDNELYLRMGETGKYRVRLKPCGSIYSVIPRRIQAPAGRLRASPTDFEPTLFSNLNCKVVQDGWRTDENGNFVTLGDVYDMTSPHLQDRADDRIPIYAGAPNVWREVTVTTRALEDYDADVRADALLSAPFAVVYNHEVYYGSDDSRSGLVSEGTGLVRISLDRPEGATLPVPAGVTIASATRVMSWDAVPGASHYLVEWRYGPRYSNRANTDRSHVSATSKTLPLGGSGRGPITARVRAYSSSAVSDWSAELTWDSRPPTLNVLDTAVNEADGSVGFLVTLDPAATGTVTVDYTTSDGTAVAGTDYTATSGTLTFAPGEREKKTDLVPIADDPEEDSGETFRLVLSRPTGSDRNNGDAVLGDAEAVATILNSEQEAAALTGFTLVDAGTNGDLMALAEGATVRLGELLASSYGIRAEMSPGAAPGSVRLELSGAKTAAATDDAAPWSLYGDGAGRINGGSLPPGSYTLTATAYADSGGRGEERGSLEVSFTVAAGALGVTTPGPFTVAEGETNVTTLAASDTGTGATASWSIPEGTAGGADRAAFALTAEGVLSLVAAKDFEAPDDADGDGTYKVTVGVREGAQTATATLAVTLADVDEAALAVTTPGPFAVAEGATAVAELAASETGSGAATWSIPAGTAGGADGAAFALTPGGVLTLVAAKDFEAPDDADGDGVYEVTVEAAVPATVAARAQSATAALLVTLTDVNEAPVAQATAPARVREGAEVTLDGSASADPDADDTLTYAWTQADDGAPRVTLSDAAAAQPVFTSPSDLAAETELAFTLTVTDAAGLHAEAAVTVTVTLISEVSVAAASGYTAEGSDAVFRLTRAGSARTALTVPVTVEETGAMLGADVPAHATFAAGSRETELRVPTVADAVSENDSRVTMRLGSGPGWQLAPDAATATLTVLDDDVAPVTGVSAADVTIWSADMTVMEYGPRSIGAGTADQFSNQQGRAGLRAKRLWYDPTERKLRLGFDDGLDDAELLTLHVGGVSLGFPANSGGDSSFSLEHVDVWPGPTARRWRCGSRSRRPRRCRPMRRWRR